MSEKEKERERERAIVREIEREKRESERERERYRKSEGERQGSWLMVEGWCCCARTAGQCSTWLSRAVLWRESGRERAREREERHSGRER